MKVTDKHNADSIDGVTRTHGPKKSPNAKPGMDGLSGEGSVDSAKVKLSGRAHDMKKIREAVDAVPDVDEAKVAKYKGLIEKGQYKVDSKAVADKMVNEHAYNDFFVEE